VAVVAAIALLCLAGRVSTVAAQEPPQTPAQLAADNTAAPEELTALGMAQRIDLLLEKHRKDAGVQAVEQCSDAEFIRRVNLDLAGVIPRVSEVHDFLEDKSPDKRRRLIQRLMASPRHATHLAILWRNIMLPVGFSIEDSQSVLGMQNWFRRQFVDNLRYDRIVSEFLVATSSSQTGPALFYTSQELKPEKLAASTSRIFLGTQIECAQCHDHPFDSWKQEDFWGYAAFFAQLRQGGAATGGNRAMGIEDLTTGEVMLPDSDRVIAPRFPRGRKPAADERGSRRVQLAIWMASRDNPYLARAAVNRVWAQMFGRGLVEPVDDLGPHNPPTHPVLLDELASFFAGTGFDLKQVYRAIANTQAYQLASHGGKDSHPELYDRMAVKRLSAEQLYDSLQRILSPPPAANRNPFDLQRLGFVVKMRSATPGSSRYEAGVLQALTMLNGQEMAAATGVSQSRILAALQSPWFDDAQRVETLFLATLSRPPTSAQKKQFLEYVKQGGAAGNSQEAMADVLWALLNSAEFTLNH